ncbi:MAG: thioredoxin family protein [Oceanipulchritudo sp.]
MTKKLLLPAMLLLAGALSATAGKGDWHTDFDKAINKAKEENKIVLVEFHGSDWCPPCMKLNDEVLSTEAFKDVAEKSLILVNADFPRKEPLPDAQREHNEALAQKLGVQYFPTVVLVDGEGEVLDKMVGFPKDGVDGFLSFIREKAPEASEG